MPNKPSPIRGHILYLMAEEEDEENEKEETKQIEPPYKGTVAPSLN